ncbi:elongation factor 1-beta [Gigaspora margarita]|uniref:Elongation factor 1-beta n=1 Tax=Gigaspora margarita TaxID=4874 RepID=A0A8H4AMC6_GIGMA|nr:elongation factor 1-beta [Gigaspora margarita]
MAFTQLDSDKGLTELNTFLEEHSYIEGYEPTQADVSVFKKLGQKVPDHVKFPHVARWYNHIASYSDEFTSLPGEEKKDDDDDDDDVDLFGSDDDELDPEEERRKAELLEAYHKKKAAKPKVIAKSMVCLDVKPWEDTTDLVEMEKLVRGITLDGLVWGASKLIPIGYGIKKLQISCVVEDDKVGIDDLEEQITSFEEHVQSVDVVSFNKL